MKFLFSIFCLAFITDNVAAQLKETFDATTYLAPKGWKKEAKDNLIIYTSTRKKDTSWCQIGIYRSTASNGAIETDFNESWTQLAAVPYKIKETPQGDSAIEADGWKIKSGAGKFIFNKAHAMALLTTFTGYGKSICILAITNKMRYTENIEALIGSLELNKTVTVQTAPDNAGTNSNMGNTTTAPATNNTADGFSFSVTNFDDGWTSARREDWVEVTKDNMKVLLHYPKAGTIFPADPGPLTNAAWDILVAPRYNNLKNYKTAYISAYERPYLGMGYATENATGKNVFIVFFRQGQSGWLEFVSPDKSSFIRQYKFDPETIQWDSETDLVIPLSKMTAYNKFAVSAADFNGKWTSDFTGVQQLYHVYSGQYAGMNINQSSEEFIFGAGNSYNWKLLAVNGMVGNTTYNQVKSTGNFTVLNNWQVHFSDIEKKQKTFNAYFSCVKGARILWLQDTGYGGFTGYAKAK